MTAHRNGPVRVEIRLEGHLDQHWTDWFAGLALAHEADGTTTLRGDLTDQAQLHGVLTQIRDVGATLISVTPLQDTDATAGEPPRGPSTGPSPRSGATSPETPSTRRRATPPRAPETE